MPGATHSLYCLFKAGWPGDIAYNVEMDFQGVGLGRL